MYPVNTFTTAGMLSRSPLQNSLDENTQAQQQKAEYFIQAVTCHLPASYTRLNTYCQGHFMQLQVK